MKRNLGVLCVLIFVMAATFLSCKNDSTTATAGEAVITGVITDAASALPLAGVVVQGQSVSAGSPTATTDQQGSYRLSFTLDSSATVTMRVGQKSGYRDTTFVVEVLSGQVFQLSFTMHTVSVVGGGTGTGTAQTIAFLGADPQQVSVYGVGGTETSILGWQVRDSLGLPIDASHAVNLNFTINGGLNGGEYVSPATVTTNASGQSFTTFNSGIRSGAVQIVATAQVGTRTITSSPVQIVINAGYADKAHFSVAPFKVNFPAMHVVGLTDEISVLVGDIYSNPVLENTAVYMNSFAGVIVAAIFTDPTGRGSADLISGNPKPMGIYATTPLGDGYHYVVASTVGQGGQLVKDSTIVLWSGFSEISGFNPASFNVPNGGSQPVSFTVSDELGHPLSSGTTISVTVTGVQALVSFGLNGSITLPDILSGGTQFSFVVIDAQADTSFVSGASVTVSVVSDNGNTYSGVSGIVH